MSLSSAGSSFGRKFFSFSGTATRSEFWYTILIGFLINVGYWLVADVILKIASPAGELGMQIAVTIPCIAAGARRLHDIGKSGWWQLLQLTGIGIFVLIYWWCLPSKK